MSDQPPVEGDRWRELFFKDWTPDCEHPENPELRSLANDKTVTTFSIATTDWVDGAERVEHHAVVTWAGRPLGGHITTDWSVRPGRSHVPIRKRSPETIQPNVVDSTRRLELTAPPMHGASFRPPSPKRRRWPVTSV